MKKSAHAFQMNYTAWKLFHKNIVIKWFRLGGACEGHLVRCAAQSRSQIRSGSGSVFCVSWGRKDSVFHCLHLSWQGLSPTSQLCPQEGRAWGGEALRSLMETGQVPGRVADPGTFCSPEHHSLCLRSQGNLPWGCTCSCAGIVAQCQIPSGK